MTPHQFCATAHGDPLRPSRDELFAHADRRSLKVIGLIRGVTLFTEAKLERGSIVGYRSGFAFGLPSRTNNEKNPETMRSGIISGLGHTLQCG